MAKNTDKQKDSGQEELKELLNAPDADAAAAKPETPVEKPAVDDLPPDLRAPGKHSDEPQKKDDEDKIVDAIAAENARDSLDDIDREEREPEGPMVIIGDEKRHWYSFIKRPKFWFSLIGLLLVALIFAWLITPSRVWLLNTVGLRTTLDFATVVSTPQGPPPMLKNALVTINGQEYHTDDNGQLKVSIPYGPAHIVISKPGYETITKDQTFDFDPFFYYLGGKQADDQIRKQTFLLKSVGIEIRFSAKDWLTGQPVTVGHFGVGDVVTTPGPQGEVALTIPATDAKTVPLKATFGGSGYADTTIDVALPNTSAELTFVPAGKHYFVSKRSGQFAVYSSNIDGTATAEVVPAAAAETGDIIFTASPNGKYGVLASTREAARDSFGSVQQKAYIVDFAGNKLTAVDTGLLFNFADWSGDTLVYTVRQRSAGGTVTERLASVNAANSKRADLANDADFGEVRLRLNSVVYLTESHELRTVKMTGGTEKSLGTAIKKLTQPEPNHFAYQIADGSWRQYDVNADQVTTVATPAAQDRAFLASASGDGQTLLALEMIDGKPALIAKAVGNGKEIKLAADAGLIGPIRWVGTVAVYRVGTADYAVGAMGGAAKKITDVSATLHADNDYFTFN